MAGLRGCGLRTVAGASSAAPERASRPAAARAAFKYNRVFRSSRTGAEAMEEVAWSFSRQREAESSQYESGAVCQYPSDSH